METLTRAEIIGILLMIAITVVLAAVIALFVFGMGAYLGSDFEEDTTKFIIDDEKIYDVNSSTNHYYDNGSLIIIDTNTSVVWFVQNGTVTLS